MRRATLQRLVDSPIAATEPELDHRLRDLLSTVDDAEAGLAAAALVLSSSRGSADGLAHLFAVIAEPRNLQAVIASLIERAPFQGDRVQPIAERLVELLLARQKHSGLAMRLAVHTHSAPALQSAIERAAGCGALHAGALMETLAAIPQVVGRRRGAEIEALEGTFAAAQDPMVRRIGLAVLAERASVAGWPDKARQRLAFYRQDASALVRETASLTFPPDPPAAS